MKLKFSGSRDHISSTCAPVTPGKKMKAEIKQGYKFDKSNQIELLVH